MSIHVGDILFTRQGLPAIVTSKDSSIASVSLEKNIGEVQKATEFGIKNGLDPEQRKTFESVRREALSPDKAEEIQRLRDRIRELKDTGGDAKVLRYLENELQHLVIREGIIPRDYMVQERTLVRG